MAKIMVQMSISLDGFVTGPNDGPDNPLGDGGESLFKWYSSGDTEYKWRSGTMTSNISADSAAYLDYVIPNIGALITGRRTFDIARAWGGRHPVDVPVVVLTRTIPEEWAGKESIFTFVNGPIETAVARARELAGEKDIAIATASVAQQCLKAGLLDEIHLDLAPVLLGGGVSMFDHLGIEAVKLERLQIIEAPDVTHLAFRVIK